jgi:hypothetical protein
MKVTEITVTIGATVSVGKQYEFARIDISNRATLDEPTDVDSKEYRAAHRKLVTSVDDMLTKAKELLIEDGN